MVKTRLLNWGLHKKLYPPELRRALEILGPDRSRWPSERPQFRIRERIVPLTEMFKSLRRRGIHDPFEWLHTVRHDEQEHPPSVELLSTSCVREDEVVSDAAGHGFNNLGSSPQNELPMDVRLIDDPERSFATDHRRSDPLSAQALCFANAPNPTIQIGDPAIYLLTASAGREMQSYCMIYTSSNKSVSHAEPDVH